MTSTSFGGETYVPERDGSRLASQLADVRTLLSNGDWWTLADIERATGHPQASISSRLRDLRKVAHGSHTIERAYLQRGLHCYRMALPKGQLSLGLM